MVQEVEEMNNKLPDGITLSTLRDLFDEAKVEHEPAFRRARILDATDKGKMWDVIGAKFPDYQILPNTNHVAYVKNNLLANIYTVSRAASIVPTSEDDKEIVTHLNVALEHAWTTGSIGYYQMQAGERAALLNKGITHVSWDNSPQGGKGDSFYEGEPVLKTISPLRFMRDPYVDDIAKASYAMTWDWIHKNVIKRDDDYKDAYAKYKESYKSNTSAANPSSQTLTDKTNNEPIANKDYELVYIFHVYGDDNKLYEIHTIDFNYTLLVKELAPAIMPYAELFCNLPVDDIVGTSEAAKIYSNSVAINLMNSFALTAEYKNQRPPKYISKNAGLDIASFRKYGNDADHTFVVQGDASKSVHYHQFPQVTPQTQALLQQLGFDIKDITGLDARYTGRDTGSILTTGGMENMLDQVTMIDQPKIVNYEKYAKRVSQLVLMNMLEFSEKRKYFYKDPRSTSYKTVEVNFPDIDTDTLFAYDLNISPMLPKNKQRVAQMANVLMEKQMQYQGTGQQVTLITPEEWLMFQDIPNKEFMLERMGIERSQDYIKKVSETIFTYAKLTETGMDPAEAMVQTAQSLQNKERPQADQVPLSEIGSPLPNQV